MTTPFPLPDTKWEGTREFWAAAERRQLVIPRCESCGVYQWYPPERCQACGQDGMRWTAVSGRGTLFSWAVVRHGFTKPFRDQVPYTTGLVALDEDPAVRLVTRLIECDPDELEIDMPVRVVFEPLHFIDISERIIAPFFEPVRASAPKNERKLPNG